MIPDVNLASLGVIFPGFILAQTSLICLVGYCMCMGINTLFLFPVGCVYCLYYHGVVKRALEWSAAGAKWNPCHRLFGQVSQLYAPASKCVADIAKLAPGHHSFVISPSLKVKTIDSTIDIMTLKF